MAEKILVGPLLGLESNTDYTVCFLAEPDSAPRGIDGSVRRLEIPSLPQLRDPQGRNRWEALGHLGMRKRRPSRVPDRSVCLNCLATSPVTVTNAWVAACCAEPPVGGLRLPVKKSRGNRRFGLTMMLHVETKQETQP